MDGIGTELGGGALLLVIVGKLLDYLRERKSKRTAVETADKSEKANGRNNPSEMTLSRKRMNGKSSMDYVLLVLDQHTDLLKDMVTAKSCDKHQGDTIKLQDDLTKVSVDVGRIEGQLSQLLKTRRNHV